MNERMTLPSGSTIELQMASFIVAMKLLKAVAAELKAVDLGFELGPSIDVAKLMEKGVKIDALKNVVCQALASDAVERTAWECMACCLYNGQRIARTSFEEQNARQDFLPTAWEVIKFNLTPFFANLGLKSSTASPTPDADQK